MCWLVRAAGIEPARAMPNGFSYRLRLSPPSIEIDVRGLDYPFTMPFTQGLGAARLVSTPSSNGSSVGSLARDCHFKGFPEFEQFCSADFSARTQAMNKLKSAASTCSATPAHHVGLYRQTRSAPRGSFRQKF
jgi:hypothetical protein